MKAGSAECAGFLQALRRRGTIPDPAVEATVREALRLKDPRHRMDGGGLVLLPMMGIGG